MQKEGEICHNFFKIVNTTSSVCSNILFYFIYRMLEKSLIISEKKHFISNEMFIMWKKTP